MKGERYTYLHRLRTNSSASIGGGGGGGSTESVSGESVSLKVSRHHLFFSFIFVILFFCRAPGTCCSGARMQRQRSRPLCRSSVSVFAYVRGFVDLCFLCVFNFDLIFILFAFLCPLSHGISRSSFSFVWKMPCSCDAITRFHGPRASLRALQGSCLCSLLTPRLVLLPFKSNRR